MLIIGAVPSFLSTVCFVFCVSFVLSPCACILIIIFPTKQVHSSWLSLLPNWLHFATCGWASTPCLQQVNLAMAHSENHLIIIRCDSGTACRSVIPRKYLPFPHISIHGPSMTCLHPSPNLSLASIHLEIDARPLLTWRQTLSLYLRSVNHQFLTVTLVEHTIMFFPRLSTNRGIPGHFSLLPLCHRL